MFRRVVQRATGVRPEETSAAAWAALFFFCVLCSYYTVRPVREEMGIARGADNLPWLFLCTLGAMLLATPVFGWLVSRFPRRLFIAITYRFFIVTLVLFYGALLLLQHERFGIPGHAFQRSVAFLFGLPIDDMSPTVLLGYSFYVWLSVFNLFIVSVFWALAADVFSLARSKRLFGAIAAGGTVGAIAGSALAASLTEHIGRAHLILICAILLEAAAQCAARLALHAPAAEPDGAAPTRAAAQDAMDGIVQTSRSPYLLGVALFILALTFTSTIAYFEQGRIVDSAFADDRDGKVVFFAKIDLWVNVVTLVLQVGTARFLLTRIGTGWTLAFLPLITAAGFAALLLAPTLLTLALFQIIRRASNYGLAKPARETLFTVVDTEEKYKAKTFIDTFVYRAGDGIAAVVTALSAIPPLVIAAIPISILWLAVSLFLGRRQRLLALTRRESDESPTPPAAALAPTGGN